MTEEFSEKPHIDLVDDIPSTLPPSNPKIENPNGDNQNGENLQNNDSQNQKIEILKESSSLNQNPHLNKEVRFSNYNTLDEPVTLTLARDLLRILHKIEYVLIPHTNVNKKKELQNWDLWGPLIFCLLLCLIISSNKGISAEKSFIYIFVIVWIGGIIITFNAQFLGAIIGICQSCCLLGYCIFPILIGAIILKAIGDKKAIVKFIIMTFCVIWSCFSSVGFMSTLCVKEKKFLMVFPVYLFYISIAIFVLNV